MIQMSGPKPRYTPETAKLAGWMARSGLINSQIAGELKINEATLYRWQKKYPELKKALQQNKTIVDAQVEDSLLKRAMGYEYDETHVESGAAGKTTKIKKIRKHVVADTTAAIFWLKNRQPERWRDKIEMELGGKVTHDVDLTGLTTEDLKELIKYGNSSDEGAEE